MPASAHAFPFDATYTALAGSSPTSTTVSPGVTPRAFSTFTSSATRSRTRRAISRPSITTAVVSARKIHRPRLADRHDLDLAGVLQLGLDAPRDLFGERAHAHVVDVVRRDDDAHLAACLDGKDLLHALIAGRDLLQPLETFHVRLECFAPRARPRAADGVGRLHEHRDLALVRHIVMVRRDAVHHHRILPVLRRDLDAELHVCAFVLVREDLADVVQQRAAFGHGEVEPELGGHDAGKPRHFLGVLENVLAVARPPMHPADQLDDFRMQAVHAEFVRGLLPELHDVLVDLALRLVDEFLDASRMDAPVGDQLLEREPGHLAPNRIEARHDHRVRSVVDDDVHAGRQLERADVASLAPDDAALHLVAGQRHRRHRRLGRVFRRDTLDGEGHDLLRLALGVTACPLANLAELVRGVGVRFLLQPTDQLRLGVLRRHASQLFQSLALVRDELLELVLAFIELLLAPPELTGAAAQLLVALIEDVEFAIERTLPVDDSLLLAFHFRPPAAHFDLELLAQLDQLFLAGDHRALSQRFGFPLGLADDALRRLLGARSRGCLSLPLRGHAQPPPYKEKSRRGDYENA